MHNIAVACLAKRLGGALSPVFFCAEMLGLPEKQNWLCAFKQSSRVYENNGERYT